jgi:acyl-coenzyme A thioesterase PaaI-like protein
MAPRVSSRLFRHLINVWPPFRGAGIRVVALSTDWTYARVELRETVFNRNAVGTHFGGSLFAMTDPLYVLMLTRLLGEEYRILDQAADIEYLQPGRGIVTAEFRLEAQRIDDLRREAANGLKVLPEFLVEVRDQGGNVVARVRKRIYVRLKKHARPGTP